MIDPRYWIKHALARSALRSYPLYDVPHKSAEDTMSEKHAQENFDYFMHVRLERLAFFTGWLKSHFRFVATLDGNGLKAVSQWLDNYGGGLVGDESGTQTIFATYQPVWKDTYVGYNVMIDIGIFLGEYLIAKRPKLHWELYRGHEIEPETFSGVGYMRPCLGGMPNQWKPHPLTAGYNVIANSRKLAKIQQNRTERSVLIRKAKSILYLSNLPDGDGPIIIGDSSNEPI